MAKEFFVSVVIQAIDKLTAPFKKIQDRVNHLQDALRPLNNSLYALGQGLGVPKVMGSFRQLGSSIKHVLSPLYTLLQGLGLVGSVATIAGLTQLIHKYAEAGDKIAKISHKIGLSAEAFQELQFVAGRANINPEQFETALTAFTKRVGELRAGTGTLYAMLQRVSPELSQMVLKAKTNEQAFTLMGLAISKLQDPAKRAAFAAAAFGRSGVDMVNMFAEGMAGVAHLRQEANRLGLVISGKAAKEAEAFEDSLVDMRAALTGVVNVIGGILIPQLQPLIQLFTNWLVTHRQLIASRLEAVIMGVVKALKSFNWERFWQSLTAIGTVIRKVVGWLGGWENAFIAVLVMMNGPFILGIALLAKAFIGLGVVMLATPIGWIIAGIAAISGAIYLLVKKFTSIKDTFAQFWTAFPNGIAAAWQRIQDHMTLGVNQLIMLLKNMGTSLIAFLTSPFETAQRVINNILESVTSTLSYLKELLPEWLKGKTVEIKGPSKEILPQALEGPKAAVHTWAPPQMVFPTSFPETQSSNVPRETKIKVLFENMPRGTRVVSEPSSNVPLELDMGYSMAHAF